MENFHDDDSVLLNFDQGNADNEVNRHTFLSRMREIVPGISRWLELIYPTDVTSKVYYRGRVIERAAGCRQGCTLMGACDAVVNRMLHEATGVVPVPDGCSVQPLAALTNQRHQKTHSPTTLTVQPYYSTAQPHVHAAPHLYPVHNTHYSVAE